MWEVYNGKTEVVSFVIESDRKMCQILGKCLITLLVSSNSS